MGVIVVQVGSLHSAEGDGGNVQVGQHHLKRMNEACNLLCTYLNLV